MSPPQEWQKKKKSISVFGRRTKAKAARINKLQGEEENSQFKLSSTLQEEFTFLASSPPEHSWHSCSSPRGHWVVFGSGSSSYACRLGRGKSRSQRLLPDAMIWGLLVNGEPALALRPRWDPAGGSQGCSCPMGAARKEEKTPFFLPLDKEVGVPQCGAGWEMAFMPHKNVVVADSLPSPGGISEMKRTPSSNPQ